MNQPYPMSVIIAILECIEERGSLQSNQISPTIKALKSKKHNTDEFECSVWTNTGISQFIDTIEEELLANHNFKRVQTTPLL